MKDFHPCFEIYVNIPGWMYEYLDIHENHTAMTDSEWLWFALLCFAAES